MRIAKSKLAVGGDGCLEVPNLETLESRSLRVEHGGFGKNRIHRSKNAKRSSNGRCCQQLAA
jgi:hypothetical protein